MQWSEQNCYNGSAWEPQPPVDGGCYINTEKIIVPSPGILRFMKQRQKLDWSDMEAMKYFCSRLLCTGLTETHQAFLDIKTNYNPATVSTTSYTTLSSFADYHCFVAYCLGMAQLYHATFCSNGLPSRAVTATLKAESTDWKTQLCYEAVMKKLLIPTSI